MTTYRRHRGAAELFRSAPRGDRGITLIELLVVIVIVTILASAIMPITRMTVRRAKEIELRSALRSVRTAIDAFNKDCVTKKLSSDRCTNDNYPETLAALIEPQPLTGPEAKTRKYLRRIPRDPFAPPDTGYYEPDWGLRSTSDLPDSTNWGGENVYDIYTKYDGFSSDGSKYNTW